ncbi:hypothetical protein [Bacillus litorisediminis]|uniref:hypothetical protein n=1 Tax=Bacillus litorisediminis TaxID=2922713 RepID=UPI001FAE120A|nr:hypothetical protein [Bacillus litorisediminis]
METKIKTITKTVYVANDGKEFDDEDNCLCHEQELAQEERERNIEKDLGFETNANFPSMLNTNRSNHEYKLFLIKNESDLDRFVEIYEYWFTNLKNYWEVNKETFVYPDVLCILDFPTGGDERRLYRLSQLCRQFNAFVDEVFAKTDDMMQEI